MRALLTPPWVVVLPLFVGCENEYQGAPTPCDDWCRVTQRADCAEDWPSDCVRNCASRGDNAAAERCPADWQALIDCYADRPTSDYYCNAGRSRSIQRVCTTEHMAMLACANPEIVSCFEHCDRAAACGFVDAVECYDDCWRLNRACGPSAVTYFECVRDHQPPAEQAVCDSFALIDLVSCPEATAPLLECLERRGIDVFDDPDDGSL